MKKLIFLIVCLITNFTFAQVLNQYKYAIVPEKYSFQKNKNDYNLNELTKAAMRKYGFNPYFEAEILPKDISNDNKLFVDVLENSSMIYTKLIIVLRDYTNNVLFRSAEGTSKEKEFSVAYEECFRQAMKSFDVLKHQYQDESIKEVFKNVQNQTSTLIDFSCNAKKISNGYMLFNEKGEALYTIYYSSNSNIFFIDTATVNIVKGILIYKKDSLYSYEYYQDNKLFIKNINILF